MSYLLDVNICSDHMRRPGGLAHRFFQHSGRLYVPTIVLAELYLGAYQHPSSHQLLAAIADLVQEVQVLDFDVRAAEEFGRLHAEVRRVGHAVARVDLLIAAVAVVHQLTLVTHNTSDFVGIPGLQLEDWLLP